MPVPVDRTEIRYAWNGEIALAYQIVGGCPLDLIYMQGSVSNLEVAWENPALARAVNIGARVGGKARASEVLVSQTVKDLVAGSGLSFEDRGRHELKGIPDEWHLFAVAEQSNLHEAGK